jgi:hypothetical protein
MKWNYLLGALYLIVSAVWLVLIGTCAYSIANGNHVLFNAVWGVVAVAYLAYDLHQFRNLVRGR